MTFVQGLKLTTATQQVPWMPLAFAVIINAPRTLHDLRPQMPCPFFKECCQAFNSYFEKQALKIFSFITGMNWKLINVYQGDNQIKNENKTCLPSGFPGKGGGGGIPCLTCLGCSS